MVHTITNGWYGTQRGGLYIYNVTKLKITNTEPTTSSFSWDIDTTGLKGYVVNGTEVDIYFPEGDTLKLGSPTNYLQGVFSNNHYSNIFSGVRKFEGLELLDVSDTTSLASLFSDLGSLVDTSGWSEDDFDYWDLSSWDVSNVSSLYSVFSKVKILGKVNLKGWKHNVTVGRSDFMFSECSNLKTILTGEYDLSGVTNTTSMFYNCTSLVGGNGTTFSSSYINGQRARVDRDGQEGYFTGHAKHKVCGVTGACIHTQLSAHPDNLPSWTPVEPGISVEDFATLLATSGAKNLYLNSDIGVKGSPYTVTTNAVTFICLNGFNIYDISFSGSEVTNITNCCETNSTIYQSPSNNEPVFKTLTKFIFGVNKNITIDAKSLINYNSVTVNSIYLCDINIKQSEDKTFDDTYFIEGHSSRCPSVYIEKASVSNMKEGGLVKNSAAALKNVDVSDCTFQNYFLRIARNDALGTNERSAISLDGIINIKNSTIGTLFDVNGDNLNIKGNVDVNNNTFTKNVIIANKTKAGRYSYSTGGSTEYGTEGVAAQMEIESSGTLNFHDNVWRRDDSSSNMYVVSVETTTYNTYSKTNALRILGNFYFKNNRITNIASVVGEYICGIYIKDGNYTIGSGVTDMSGNTTDANSTYFSSSPEKGSFIDIVSDRTVSIMQLLDARSKVSSKQRFNILFTSEDGQGCVWQTGFNNNEVDTNFRDDAYQIFRPVTLGTVRRNLVTALVDSPSPGRVEIRNAGTHSHKICGVSSGTACSHTFTDAHTGTVTYKPLYGGTWTAAMFNAAMDENRRFYLMGNVRVNGNIQVSYISRLCLNGYSITGVNFSSNNEMAICNCQTTTSTISNDGTYRFKEGYLYVYGNNKNIEIKTNYLSKLEPYALGGASRDYMYRKVGLYDLTVKPYSSEQTNKNIINSTGAAPVYLEKVDIQDIKSSRFINQAAGILKDVNVSNCVFTDGFMNSLYNHPDSNLAYKSENIGNPSLSGNINISSVSMARLLRVTGLELTVDGNVNVEDCTFTGQEIFHTGVSSFRWQTNPYTYGYRNFEAIFTVTEDGSINVSNNTVNKYDGIMYVFRVGSERGSYDQGDVKSLKLSILGEFTYTNNKYVGVTAESSAYIAGIYMRDSTERVTIGSKKIVFENNTTDATDEAKATNPLYTNFIPVVSLTTDRIFNRADTSTILSNESRMEVLFATTSGKGEIVSNWEGLDGTDYRTIFTAATYSELRKYMKVYHDETMVFVDSHHHTVCGLATCSEAHTFASVHSAIDYEPFPKGLDTSKISAYLNGTEGGLGNYIFLRENITLTSAISVGRNLNICLNGFSITGGFGSSNYKITITNCKEAVSEINSGDQTAFRFVNFELYGQEINGEKNINITAGMFIDYGVASNRTAYIYNARFTKYDGDSQNDNYAIQMLNNLNEKVVTLEKVDFVGSTNTNYRNSVLFYVGGGTTNNILNLKDVTIKNYKSISNSIMTVGGAVNMYGTNTIEGTENYTPGSSNSSSLICVQNNGIVNIHDGTLNIINNKVTATSVMYVGDNATFNVAADTTINVTGNKLYGVDANQRIMMMTPGNILGNLNVTGNKIIQDGSSTYRRVAVEISSDNSVNIGTGSIVIRDNEVYTETDENSINAAQHMYGLYSPIANNATSIFTQKAGTKFSKDSFIERIKFGYDYGFGHVIDNWNDDTAEDYKNFQSRLFADDYDKELLKVVMDKANEDVVIAEGYYVEFKYANKTYTKFANQRIIKDGLIDKLTGEPEDYTGGKRKFYGWATKSNAKTTEIIDFDTFTIEGDTILYAVYEGHTHTICGATTSVCSHVDGTQHNGVQVDWEPFPVLTYSSESENETNDYINGLYDDLGQ
ncbi:MAG: BspA family leucine-rich repeat surface protein, partial [Lachnospiraceae bacterium]|nr:BspA family leucine-rich repeat surface protein [Lachnospiraceae bacterium]